MANWSNEAEAREQIKALVAEYYHDFKEKKADFKPGDRVLVPAITPDWNSLEAQAGYSMHSGGMLAGWKFSNFKCCSILKF